MLVVANALRFRIVSRTHSASTHDYCTDRTRTNYHFTTRTQREKLTKNYSFKMRFTFHEQLL